MLKKLLLAIGSLSIVLSAPMALTGCNTMAGAGQDVQKAGSKLTNEAQEHKTY